MLSFICHQVFSYSYNCTKEDSHENYMIHPLICDFGHKQGQNHVGLEKVLLVAWNSTKFDLNLNSTACKIVPLRPNPSINIIGGGFDLKGLKTWFGFQWKNNRSKQLRFLILILLTWCLTQFSLLALRVKVQGRKGQLKRGHSNCFLIESISCIKWSIFFHQYYSSGLEDISIFFLDLFPNLDEHVCKGDF